MNLKRHQTIFVSVLLITIGVVGFFTIEDLISPEEHDMSIFWSMTFTSLVSISIILVNFPIFDKVKLQFPIRIDIFKRLTIAFLISSFTAAIIITIWVLLFNAIFNEYGEAHGVEEFGLAAVIFDNIVIAVIVNFTVGAIMILRYSIIGWKNSIIEAEQYKRQSIESQYSALVNQINPHFLFNSMNALASLIPQSPEKAVEFVNRFSKIYRYVLDVKDKIVCKIKDELDFLDSYCYLQKIRFGDNLLVEKQIEASCINYYLPPLSLQLLVENAIKHNEVSKTHPLTIKIVSNGEYIAVTNNLKLKFIKQDSPGIGLKNLKERYHHLTNLKPEFYIKNNEYIAKVPLIKEE
jgi:sensor histidine kinase YesM